MKLILILKIKRACLELFKETLFRQTTIFLIAASNVIESGYQCAFMGPTEILAKQHYELAKKILGKKI